MNMTPPFASGSPSEGMRSSDRTASPSQSGMAQSTADRQRAFKQSMKDAGYVRLEAYVTKEQREKFRQLGGDEWLRKKIEQAKQPPDERSLR